MTPRKWNKQSFFDELAKRNDSKAVAVARALFDWSEGNASCWWGKGKQTGSFVATKKVDEKYHIFRVLTKGNVEINFQYLKDTSLFSDETMRLQLLDRLNEIQDVSLSRDRIAGRLSIPLSVLAPNGTLS